MSLCKKYILKFCVATLFFCVFSNLNAQKSKETYFGFGIAYQMPTNILGDKDFSFNTVASNGVGLYGVGAYFFNPLLAIEGELGYSWFPNDKDFWNTANYGSTEMKYRMLSLNFQGNFYLNESDFRPYIGAVFGFNLLMNKLEFDSATASNSSSSYSKTDLNAGLGPEFGFLYEISKKELLQFALRFIYMPNVQSEYDPVNEVTINPHGKQNYFGLSVKYLFSN